MKPEDIIELFERSGIVLRGCTYEPHKVIEFVNACVDKKHSKPPEQQDIIRMAREAGIQGMCTDVICTFDELTKFAQLVVEAKQEECAKVVCDHADSIRLFQNESQIIEDERRIRVIGQADTNTKGTHE